MNDLLYVGMLFSAFAIALVLYGGLIAKTGRVELLPYRSRHSIGSSEDVRRVGRIVVIVGLVIGALSLVLMLVAPKS